jgi:hypothetical protein
MYPLSLGTIAQAARTDPPFAPWSIGIASRSATERTERCSYNRFNREVDPAERSDPDRSLAKRDIQLIPQTRPNQ